MVSPDFQTTNSSSQQSLRNEYWASCFKVEKRSTANITLFACFITLIAVIILSVAVKMSPNRLTRPLNSGSDEGILVGPKFLNPSKPEIFIKANSNFLGLSLFQRLTLYAPSDASPVDLYVCTEPLPQSYTVTTSSGKGYWKQYVSLSSDAFYFQSPIKTTISSSAFKVRIHIIYAKAIETDYPHFVWKDHEKTYDFSLDGENWRFIQLCRLSIIIFIVILLGAIFLMSVMSIIPVTRQGFVWLSTIAITAFILGIIMSTVNLPRPDTSEFYQWLENIFLILMLWLAVCFIPSMVIVVLIKRILDYSSSPLISGV